MPVEVPVGVETVAAPVEMPSPPVPGRTSRLAFTSLAASVFAFGVWFFSGMAAPLVAVIAVVLGIWARWASKGSAGRLTGRALAGWGLWLGVIHLVLFVVGYTVLGTMAA
jgi:hypothetical protein